MLRLSQLPHIVVLAATIFMIYRSLKSHVGDHVENVATFLFEQEIADSDHCFNPSVVIERFNEFGVAYVFLAFAFQLLCCFVVFSEMHRYKKGKSGDIMTSSAETYPGFNATVLCGIQVIASGLLFSRILYYYEILEMFGGELKYVRETGALGCF